MFQTILNVVVALAPVYPFVFAVAFVLAKRLEALLPHNTVEQLHSIVAECVAATEQVYAGSSGANKKQVCMAAVEAACKAAHIPFDSRLADTFIESVVLGMNAGKPTESLMGPVIPVSTVHNQPPIG